MEEDEEVAVPGEGENRHVTEKQPQDAPVVPLGATRGRGRRIPSRQNEKDEEAEDDKGGERKSVAKQPARRLQRQASMEPDSEGSRLTRSQARTRKVDGGNDPEDEENLVIQKINEKAVREKKGEGFEDDRGLRGPPEEPQATREMQKRQLAAMAPHPQPAGKKEPAEKPLPPPIFKSEWRFTPAGAEVGPPPSTLRPSEESSSSDSEEREEDEEGDEMEVDFPEDGSLDDLSLLLPDEDEDEEEEGHHSVRRIAVAHSLSIKSRRKDREVAAEERRPKKRTRTEPKRRVVGEGQALGQRELLKRMEEVARVAAPQPEIHEGGRPEAGRAEVEIPLAPVDRELAEYPAAVLQEKKGPGDPQDPEGKGELGERDDPRMVVEDDKDQQPPPPAALEKPAAWEMQRPEITVDPTSELLKKVVAFFDAKVFGQGPLYSRLQDTDFPEMSSQAIMLEFLPLLKFFGACLEGSPEWAVMDFALVIKFHCILLR